MLRNAIVLAGLSWSASAARADAPPTGRIALDVVSVSGSGCPAGSGLAAMSPDNTWIALFYQHYQAVVGVGALPIDLRKNCQFNLLVHAPPTFSYAIAAADYLGFASLAAGATARYQTSYFFQGDPPPAFDEHTLSGPLLDDFGFFVTRDESALVFSPCNASTPLTVRSIVRVAAGTSDPTRTTSFVSIDSDSEVPPTSFHLVWRRCPDASSSSAAASPPRA